MWALLRRSGLFIVSYGPLAAMFVATKWPRGWSARDLLLLALWLVGVTGVLLFPFAAAFFTRGARKRALVAVAVSAASLVAVGGYYRWYAPMAWHAPAHRTHATASAVAFALCVAAVSITVIILLNARQVAELHWRITDPRDQGGAVAGYLATYLLPLLSLEAHSWNTAVAYGIYLLTVYVIFVRSDNLVLVNPTLYLFRYRIFDVQLDPPDGVGRRRVLLLTRAAITETAEVDVLPLGDDCYLAAKPPRQAA
jgi:hypothetical protein